MAAAITHAQQLVAQVMNVFQAAQPALLYIVPAVLGAVGLAAAKRGQFWSLFHFSEAQEGVQEEAAGEASAAAVKQKET